MSTPAQKHDVFQAVSDPTRRKLMKLLADQELPITDISSHFPITRTAVSKHLRILAEARLVSGRKVGREKLYKLQPEPLSELQEWLAYFDRYWDNKLSMLKYKVENSDKKDNL
ncbi:ArsR/SmtB family transcription factor [Bacillus sp. z60-18]|uniref:ArsR/SmtB family transcription factor n=1 Tax=Bacillus TaxID=1386 RepID=UPI00098A816A|nr:MULTISPECIES: metalloregulator ArsR/SmtB family transcription factor [Bacillus]WFA03994.1 metalloregulator ArsR/SmtB family transcription factor [Bacillus sp. HSf4]